MVATRKKSKSMSGSRKNKSKHSYFMRGCSSRSRSCNHSRSRSCNHSRSNKHNFFAKGMDYVNVPKMKTHGKIHGKLSSKKCKCVCHLNKHNVPECKCNCNQTSKVFGGGTSGGGTTGGMCMKGGDALHLSLAYTGKQVPLSPSPYAAYVGKGGNNAASVNKAYPTVKDTGGNIGWLNSSQTIRGGSSRGPEKSYADGLVGSSWTSNPLPYKEQLYSGDNANQKSLYNVDNVTKNNGLDKLLSGVKKVKGMDNWSGAGGGTTGPGTSYVNGLVGSSWTSNPTTWSGVNGVGGDGNHLSLNNYNNDVSRQMLDIGANYPFNGMLSGGGRHRHRCKPDCKCGRGSHRCKPDCGCVRVRVRGSKHSSTHKKSHRGGGFLPQNLVNVGRNFMYNIGASNNEMNGYADPPKPMPYQGQLVSNDSKFLKYI